MKEQGLVHDACRWCYAGLWGILTSYFKLPKGPPNLPSVEGEQVQYLRPSEAWLRYRKFHFWVLLFLVDISLTVAWIVIFVVSPLAGILITPLALAIIVLPDILAYIAIHLNYDTTWYVLTDRSMRLRRGVWNMHETTITFENIQNIHVQQGPLQRWFGFSNLMVQTAGGGGGEGHASHAGAHVGFLEGLENASEIREQILARSGRSAGAGLGEEPSRQESETGGAGVDSMASPTTIALLEQIRDIARNMAKP